VRLIITCDAPLDNRLTFHILVTVAENERELGFTYTIATPAAAEAHRIRLGNILSGLVEP
jgi:hypothetical protein